MLTIQPKVKEKRPYSYLLGLIIRQSCSGIIVPFFQAQSDAQIDTLTSEQASSLVANLNLGPIYTILQDSSDAPLSQIPGMEPECLDSFFVSIMLCQLDI